MVLWGTRDVVYVIYNMDMHFQFDIGQKSFSFSLLLELEGSGSNPTDAFCWVLGLTSL